MSTDTVTDTSRVLAKRRSRASALPWVTTPLLFAVFIFIWHSYVSGTGISAFILPSPQSVLAAWIELLLSPRAWGHTWMTVYETLVGFGWGLFIAVGLGVLIGRIHRHARPRPHQDRIGRAAREIGRHSRQSG